ncbi:unnamed protein product [Cuscuta epithymum]|uniref:Uncharacterized protein n=1 Tax=Cuscuta epithymum TaxID=186058 RepID=A0AAV0E2R9_9ASTE|nr:unnamed protein product [Cuscuta epithymum]
MSSLLLSLTLLLLFSFASTKCQPIRSSPRLLDLLIRDYTFQSYHHRPFKTGKLRPIRLPANFTDIVVNSVRFRCGSLGRYGAHVKEFRISPGSTFQHCSKRLLLVTQRLGSKWSNMYYDNFDLSGYTLISPVLGLLAYNATNNNHNVNNNDNSRAPFEVEIIQMVHEQQPITIDFSYTPLTGSSSETIPLCAIFGHDGKVKLANMVSGDHGRVCVAQQMGHFGLVIESPLMPLKDKKVRRWRMVIGSSIGVALGAFLIGLLLVAIFVKAKNKARKEELVRRAYEEEALQVSMVGLGHVRAQSATDRHY